MKAIYWSMAALLCAVLLLLNAGELKASDRVGIYAIVEKVIFEPNDAAPERIQIWGAFALSDPTRFAGYEAPRRGYLYYTLPRQAATALKEWSDLKSVAGTGVGVGFGGRPAATGRVRKESEKPEAPDVYPIHLGLTKMGSVQNQSLMITQLRDALKAD